MNTCPTCGKPDHSPFRSYDPAGRIVLGCVDAHHDGALVTPSASASWHMRREAKQLRRAMKQYRSAR